VAYDCKGNIVTGFGTGGVYVLSPPPDGVRYLWQITVDSQNQTVTFHGQDGFTGTIPWATLVIN
jgi:hypothetical protein